MDTSGLERRGPHTAERGSPPKETEEQPDPGLSLYRSHWWCPCRGAGRRERPAECQDTLQALGKPCQSGLRGSVGGEEWGRAGGEKREQQQLGAVTEMRAVAQGKEAGRVCFCF